VATEKARARRTTHGCSGTPEHLTWKRIRQRCLSRLSPDYADYGGRGIAICQRWSAFENFLADMGPRPSPEHSIDRIDNDGNYEPSNCRWATIHEQARNRRNNRYVEVCGERMLLCVALERFGIADDTYRKRLRLGWSEDRALSAPIRRAAA
jgi:hypothetical protein